MDALLEGEDIDPKSGLPHLAHALACIAIIIDAKTAGKLIDDRPFSNHCYRKLVEEMTPHVKRLVDQHADRHPKHWLISDAEAPKETVLKKGSQMEERPTAVQETTSVASPTSENQRWMCLLCGRNRFSKPEAHKCVGGYRKRFNAEAKRRGLKNSFVRIETVDSPPVPKCCEWGHWTTGIIGCERRPTYQAIKVVENVSTAVHYGYICSQHREEAKSFGLVLIELKTPTCEWDDGRGDSECGKKALYLCTSLLSGVELHCCERHAKESLNSGYKVDRLPHP